VSPVPEIDASWSPAAASSIPVATIELSDSADWTMRNFSAAREIQLLRDGHEVLKVAQFHALATAIDGID